MAPIWAYFNYVFEGLQGLFVTFILQQENTLGTSLCKKYSSSGSCYDQPTFKKSPIFLTVKATYLCIANCNVLLDFIDCFCCTICPIRSFTVFLFTVWEDLLLYVKKKIKKKKKKHRHLWLVQQLHGHHRYR